MWYYSFSHYGTSALIACKNLPHTLNDKKVNAAYMRYKEASKTRIDTVQIDDKKKINDKRKKW